MEKLILKILGKPEKAWLWIIKLQRREKIRLFRSSFLNGNFVFIKALAKGEWGDKDSGNSGSSRKRI